MVARAKQKKRGQVSRHQKKLILIGAEGKNKTELQYFQQFNRTQNRYTIKPAKGNTTDPENIVEDMIKSIKHEELAFDEGDLAYCVFDGDTKTEKQSQIDKAVTLAKKHNVEVLLSVPFFEVWFLQHFEYSTAELTSDDAIERLKRYIPTYDKNVDVFSTLEPKMGIAIEHAKRLEKYHDELGRRAKSITRNPSTDGYVLAELVSKFKA